jgi:MoxR-like ATPase
MGDVGRGAARGAVSDSRGAKARAVLHGSYLVRWRIWRRSPAPVLTHRILTNFQAQSEGVGSPDIITRLLEEFAENQRRG